MFNKIRPVIVFLVLSALTFVGGLTYVLTDTGCTQILEVIPTMGSQGFRIWSGPTLVSFEHQNKKICIEDGWEALGEKDSGSGFAYFDDGVTGVVIKTDAFSEKKLSFIFSGYEVRLVFPKNTSETELELYEATTRNAFEKIGALFNDSKTSVGYRHTVLVTPGIERTDGNNTPLYPDPREKLSIYVRSPRSARGEELMIHAVAHLYNRHRTDLMEYQKNQFPIPAGDFQELEASWSEIANRTSNAGRATRMAYLYNVHTAVQTKNFALIVSEPFNSDKAEFEHITKNIIVSEDAPFLTAQYGHYILGPLVMTATEGLLSTKKTGTTVEKILSQVHAKNTSYFEELSAHLPPEEISEIRSWMFEGKTVPYELVQLSMETYGIR